jgi:hypothetical protein
LKWPMENQRSIDSCAHPMLQNVGTVREMRNDHNQLD